MSISAPRQRSTYSTVLATTKGHAIVHSMPTVLYFSLSIVGVPYGIGTWMWMWVIYIRDTAVVILPTPSKNQKASGYV